MYQYDKGLIIREGVYGIKVNIIKKMHNEVGWSKVIRKSLCQIEL